MANNSLINRVVMMQQQGYSDDQIVASLGDEGLSPKEINDVMAKSKIKAAVYQPEYQYQPQQAQYPMPAEQQPVAQAQPQPIQPQQQEQQAYPEYVQGMSTETVTEIAEQIVADKITELTKSISDISSFKERVTRQVVMLDERLKKIESTIEDLRSAIIRKLGDNAENVKEIKEEMGMMQNSFAKVMTPLAENVRKLEDMLGKSQPTRPKA